MSKLPAIQFYPGDWKKDPGVQALSFHDRGVWFEMLLLMHESDERGKLMLNNKPMPTEALARLLGLDNQILTTTITNLIDYGVASRCETTGAIVCRRMVRDEQIRQVRKACGKLGGNPRLVNQNVTTEVNQIPTPSFSSSSSITSSSLLCPKKNADVQIPEKLRAPEVQEAASLWWAHLQLEHPDKLPQPNSPQMQAFWNDANRMGPRVFIDAVNYSAKNHWATLRERPQEQARAGPKLQKQLQDF